MSCERGRWLWTVSNRARHSLYKLHSECLTKEALEGFGDLKIGGQIIHTVKYADDLVLLAKEEKVLQNTRDKLN